MQILRFEFITSNVRHEAPFVRKMTFFLNGIVLSSKCKIGKRQKLKLMYPSTTKGPAQL